MSNRKFAFSVAEQFSKLSPKAQRALFAGATGLMTGGVTGGLTYLAKNPEDFRRTTKEKVTPKDLQRRRRNYALASGLLSGGLIGLNTYNLLNSAGDRASQDYQSGYSRSGRSAAPPPPSWRDAFKDVYDTSRHGAPLKRVYDTVVGSSELNDQAKRAAFQKFMSSVGTPGADVNALKGHMDVFHGDSAARQLMNVLMNKHHGKTGSYRGHLKAATLLALYRTVYNRR